MINIIIYESNPGKILLMIYYRMLPKSEDIPNIMKRIHKVKRSI